MLLQVENYSDMTVVTVTLTVVTVTIVTLIVLTVTVVTVKIVTVTVVTMTVVPVTVVTVTEVKVVTVTVAKVGNSEQEGISAKNSVIKKTFALVTSTTQFIKVNRKVSSCFLLAFKING